MSDHLTRLIKNARGGDRVALERLLVANTPALRSHVARRMPNRTSATVTVEDVIQETLIDTYTKIDQLRGDSERVFVNWLKAIAEVTLLRLLRDEARKKRGGGVRRRQFITNTNTSDPVDILDVLPTDSLTASRKVARHEAIAALQVAIAGLPADQRQAIQLHLLRGNSIEETASAMGRTQDSIRSLIYRGKQNLAEAMGRASLWLSQR